MPIEATGMEITILDADDDRYDPELKQVDRDHHRYILVTEHSDPPPFSLSDRVRIILASDTYKDRDGEFSEIVKQRKELATVVGKCTAKMSEVTLCWEVTQVDAVDDVLDADNTRFSVTNFD